MKYTTLSYETLRMFSQKVFETMGVSTEESSIITDVLLLADLYGIESHGIQRMIAYFRGIREGYIKLNAPLETVHETPVSALLDGHSGVGQVISHHAMKLAIKKAKESGVGIVTVRNSNHFGIAGYYAKMACDEGLLGLSSTNTEPIVLPTFGRKAMLGTNPIACAFPADPYPFFLDVATSVVPRGKLEVYNKAEKAIPLGWAADHNGLETSDAALVLQNVAERKGGGIFPLGGVGDVFGGHKGYGFNVLSELLTSILSLGTTSIHCTKGNTSHFFMAIDPALFAEPLELKKHFSSYLEELRNSPAAYGKEHVYTHGEKEAIAYAERMQYGIPVDEKTMQELYEIAAELTINVSQYFN